MAWDQDPEVLSPVGRPMREQLAEGPRRQALDGFEPVYRDFVDYIVRCTHRIWEEKNVGLCRTHYSDDCVMHTLAGPSIGMEVVTQNTVGSLASYADRVVLAEDVIWSEDAPGEYYSSHRISSRSTHFGDEPLIGSATMRGTGVTTIADCKVIANRIVEEWLVRDNTTALWQVGADPHAFAAAAAAADLEGDQGRHAWRTEAMAATRTQADVAIEDGHPAAPLATMLRSAFVDDMYGDAAAHLSPCAEVRWPSRRRGFGRGYWIGCLMQLCNGVHDRAFRCEHVAARPLPHGDIAVALRWSLAGTHKGTGVWGQPSGRDLWLLAVSHYRIRGGLVVEDATVFDEVSVLRQIAGGAWRMSGLDHLRALAQGNRPEDDGLLGNTRCAWGRNEHLSEEAILAAFSAQPFDLAGELVAVENPQAAAIIGEGRALVADLYDGRIGRMWRVGEGIAHPPEPAIDVAFDPDMRQERGDISFRAEDHPNLDPDAVEALLAASHDLVDRMRRDGRLRVRAFVVRAFGGPQASAALLSIYAMTNEARRSASFSYAVVAVGTAGKVRIVCDDVQPREWTPRL